MGKAAEVYKQSRGKTKQLEQHRGPTKTNQVLCWLQQLTSLIPDGLGRIGS